MTTFYLIRHGENDWVGNSIAGRTPGVHLNAVGREQARQLAKYLGGLPIRHIASSPLERARETAEPLARELALPLHLAESLNEVDFGDWKGKPIAELEPLEDWKKWNVFRSGNRAPNGESMLEVQARVVREIETLRRQFPGDSVALFGHGDPLRSAFVYYLGMPLDLLLRLEISTASVTCFKIDDWSVRFQFFNLTLQANAEGVPTPFRTQAD